MSEADTCMRCGACCACFRVAFPGKECDAPADRRVPSEMTVLVDGQRRAMRGTDGRAPRCVALDGQVGVGVRCAIYDRRPSTCRVFAVDWTLGRHNAVCSRARATLGLQPLEPF